jgi:hypothetical protein
MGEKYQCWHEADVKAHQAERGFASGGAWNLSLGTGVDDARLLRDKADRLYAEAMDEMHQEVQAALDVRGRHPR